MSRSSGDLETAMSCDIRVASECPQFAAPEIKLGWIGGGGMAAHLTHSIGASNAALMALTGDSVRAERALAWGLVSEVVPQGELMARAKAIAAVIVSRAPIASETAKANLKAAVSMPLEKAIEYERDLQTICFDGRRGGRARRIQAKAQPGFSAQISGPAAWITRTEIGPCGAQNAPASAA